MQNTDFKDFPKNYDYKATEKKIAAYWEENNIYKFDINGTTKPVFSVDTPPPYVSSAHLHVGHAMSYSQAEFIIRYKRMKGFNVFYPMGFDDNGLPTERYVEKKYKINKAKITRREFIDYCLKETRIGINTYKDLWNSLGISVDWNLTYSTIDERCRKTSQKSFIELYNKKLIERRNEPIIWCPSCRTSLAQADIAIEEFNGVLYDIEFSSLSGGKLIISTTRPELLGACVAIYANPHDSRYHHLKNEVVNVPLFNLRVPVKYDESVDINYGTGLMMVCTWGDAEDVKKWKEDKLDTRVIIDQAGRINEIAGAYKGINIREAKKLIVDDLKRTSLIKDEKPLVHNVGVHDRCDTPVEFIQTSQWFISILDHKDKFIEAGNNLNWFPTFMKTRYEEWVLNLKWDWNISRQRFYGVPFPVWYCSNCNEPIIAKEDELPVDPVVSMPKHISVCPECGNKEFIPEKDVMDTWMTSSMTPFINSLWAYDNNGIAYKGNNYNGYSSLLMSKIFPMSLRPQAQEIIRTWLFYTVVKSLYHTGGLPFKNVMISGWGLDKSGKKMSKSLGNFVAPEDIIEKYSADALRYWAAKANLGQDLRFNEEDVANGRRLLIKIWNAFRFLITNAGDDFNPYKEDITNINFGVVDKWLLTEFENSLKLCESYLESYEYSSALHVIVDFFYNTYCDDYLEIVKNIFWDTSLDYEQSGFLNHKLDKEPLYNVSLHDRKLKSLNAMYFVSLNTLKTLAPFLPFITEELFLSFYNKFEKEKSIHLSNWPTYLQDLVDESSTTVAKVLLNILRSTRKLRTNLNLHQNHKIKKLLVKSSNEVIINTISGLSADIISACRVEELVFSQSADFRSEDPDVFISLINEY
jgi:valyl-tRNA synthetase